MSEKEKSNAQQVSEIFKDLGSTFRNVSSEFAQMMESISVGIETFSSIKKMLNFNKESSLIKGNLKQMKESLIKKSTIINENMQK